MLCSRPVRRLSSITSRIAVLFALGCGDDEELPPPPQLELRIVDATTGMPIAGAQVLEATPGGGYRRHQTDANGVWSGEATPGLRTVRVEAPGYYSFPEPFMPAETVVKDTGTTVFAIGLDPRATAYPGSISGRVDGANGLASNVLVVASATIERAAVTDGDGAFVLFDLPPGDYQVAAINRGFASEPLPPVRVPGNSEPIVLAYRSIPGPGEVVTGTISPGSMPTAVQLVHAATGEPISSLSFPATVETGFAVDQLAPGRYRLRAFLERDGQVLSPDLIRTRQFLEFEISGMSNLRFGLPSAPSIEILSPTETSTSPIGTEPEFRWAAHPGATFYVVEVRNTEGQLVWGGFDARGVPRFRVLGSNTSIRFGAQGSVIEALKPGHAYRFRVYAGLDVTTGEIFKLIAASEELAGRFRLTR